MFKDGGVEKRSTKNNLKLETMNKKLQFKKSLSLREGFRMGLILFLSIGMYTTIFSQTQQSNFINYQGVASDVAGAVMTDKSITVGIALKRGQH